jgi:hypothetical protein
MNAPRMKARKKTIIIDEVTPDDIAMMTRQRVKEKMEIKTSVPVGFIRAVALRDSPDDGLRAGDVVILCERRYKTLANRGKVKEVK